MRTDLDLTEQMRVMSFEEQPRYLAECSQPLRDVATLMLETGMQPEDDAQ